MPPATTGLLLSLLAVFAGSALSVQAVLNARLRAELGSPAWAALVNYGTGVLPVLAAMLLLREPMLSAAAAGRTSWFSWIGGSLGAIYVAAGILAVPRFGAATVITMVVVGQMVGSLLIDQFGVFGVVQHPVTALRLAGAVFLILGVVLVRF